MSHVLLFRFHCRINLAAAATPRLAGSITVKRHRLI